MTKLGESRKTVVEGGVKLREVKTTSSVITETLLCPQKREKKPFF